MKAVLLIALVVAGPNACQTIDGAVSGMKPICDALIGPIRYNSTVKTSQRYAGPALVGDLKQRNQVGQRLDCPAYRQ